jgi:hypothetical protein
LHGPFTEQASMLYRRIARRHWFLGISQSQSMRRRTCAGQGGYNGIPIDRFGSGRQERLPVLQDVPVERL